MTPELQVGEFKVRVLSDGHFRLDGGAMFGVVPKALWSARLPADEQNRVRLGLNCLLIETPEGKRILVDTGLGERWTESERERLAIERPEGGLLAELGRLGLRAEDIDTVVCSHLHFDHAGGNVREESGRLVPTFPAARHVVQRVEWDDARHPHDRSRGSYRPDDFEPLEAAGQLELIEGMSELAPGVFAAETPGHCRGMQVVWLESRGQGLVFPADLMPTRAHLRPAWNMGYDLDVTATVLEKRELIERVLAADWILCFDHDPEVALVRLKRERRDGRERVEAIPLPLQEVA